MTVTLHEGTTFMLSGDDGDIRHGSDHGLYFQDSRFLARFELRLDGEAPRGLTGRARAPNEAVFVLTNPALDGVAHKQLGVLRHRLLDNGVYEELVVENYGETAARLTLSLEFEADFVHIFDVKQAVESGTRHHERLHPPTHQMVTNDALTWIRLQRDRLDAETLLGFSAAPDTISNGSVRYELEIAPHQRWQAWLYICPRTHHELALPSDLHELPPKPRRARAQQRRQRELEQSAPMLETDHHVLREAYAQAASDMISLRMKGEGLPEGGHALAAGIPWYMALFGRDSLIASYQTLLHDPTLAKGTLRALAKLQGRKVDRRSDEEPGKILHEDRHGPLVGDPKYIPTFPYYGTIDATPLFLVTLAEYVRATGDLALARELRDNVDRALEWLERYGDRDGDGFLEYHREDKGGLANQGWKDSWDSIRFRDGRIAEGSIALVEVQGYAFRAICDTAELYAHLGDDARCEELWRRAGKLRESLLDAFWVEDRHYFAEALDGHKQRADAITSNPGHLLFCGALPEDRARDVARVLLTGEMFSGFGIRTMAVGEGGYNPISYHNGSVWPHDTGLIAHGLARYHFHDEATHILEGMLAALSNYSDHRLPELFAGYAAGEFGTPIEYPSANRPQAWASGAVILLTRTLVGLEVDALSRTVSLRPHRVAGLHDLVLRGVPVGDARVEIEVRVNGDGRAVGTIHGLPHGWSRAF